MEQDDDELASRIMEAVREGDVDAVNAFLDAGGKVNLCSPSTGRTLLHVACRQVGECDFRVIASLKSACSVSCNICLTRLCEWG